MLSRRPFVLNSLAVAGGLALTSAKAAQKLLGSVGSSFGKPPVAREEPVVDALWGQKIVDPYRWMEQKPDTEEFTQFLKAQGDHARAVLDALPGRTAIKAALTRYSQAAAQVQVVQVTDHHVVYRRRDPGQDSFSVYMRAREGGEPQLILNPAQKVKDGLPRNITSVLLSPDAKRVVYAIDTGGDEVREVRVLTLADRGDVLVTSLNGIPSAWLPDSSGFYYSRIRADAKKGSTDYSFGASAWLHRIGTDPNTDQQVFRSTDGPALGQSERELPLVMSTTTSEWALGQLHSNGEWPAYVWVARVATVTQGKADWAAVVFKNDVAVEAVAHGEHIHVLAKGKSERGEIFKVAAATPSIDKRVVIVPQGAHLIEIGRAHV